MATWKRFCYRGSLVASYVSAWGKIRGWKFHDQVSAKFTKIHPSEITIKLGCFLRPVHMLASYIATLSGDATVV